jgi:peptide/nickel transport system substrate-binding protein
MHAIATRRRAPGGELDVDNPASARDRCRHRARRLLDIADPCVLLCAFISAAQEASMTALTRRELLKAGGALAAVAAAPALGSDLAAAQTPQRGGTFRFAMQLDPQGFDPHATISFVTMIPLSFSHSRLVKVKAGPSVRPGTYPIEPDVAESWTQQNETTYVFKLRKDVRWHPRPPLNGRELTAEDVKFTYDRFIGTPGNGNRPVLHMIERVEVVDRHTVRFRLKEPSVWFIDALASTSTWIVARECVEKFGDLKKVESVVGTGPWMLERWEPNIRLVYTRNPHYFVPGLPYADGVEILIDRDPSSRLASWLGGKIDFGPEFQMVVRRLDLDVARRHKPGLQTVEYPWPVTGFNGFKIAQEPFKDVRVRHALARAVSLADIFESNAFSLGHYVAQGAVPASLAEWSIPLDQLGPEGRKNYVYDTAEAKRLLAAAGYPNGFKTSVDTTSGFGPDFMDYVQVMLRNWKDAGIDAQLNVKEFGAFVSSTIYGRFDKMMASLRALFMEPDSYLALPFLPDSPLNVLGVNDPKLTEMIRLQRRTFDVAKRRDIIWDAQRHVAEQGYFGMSGAAKVLSAWDAAVRNFMPNNGYDYGGRLMAAWLAR